MYSLNPTRIVSTTSWYLMDETSLCTTQLLIPCISVAVCAIPSWLWRQHGFKMCELLYMHKGNAPMPTHKTKRLHWCHWCEITKTAVSTLVQDGQFLTDDDKLPVYLWIWVVWLSLWSVVLVSWLVRVEVVEDLMVLRLVCADSNHPRCHLLYC